ncbi:MAG: efflux RND transporter periplasmic adaptor subunit [Lysobacterales bacterium]|jgi:HlyD family secretion protein
MHSDLTRDLGLDHATRRGRKRRWLFVGGVAVILALVMFSWLKKDNTGAVQYRTEPARRGDLTVTVTATGTLEPTNQVDVGSELSGIVDAVYVDYNDSVKVGQDLAKLDTSKLDAQVLQSKAALSAAKAKVVEAKATVLETKLNYDRCASLAKTQMCSSQDLDTARAAHARAQAAEASAKAAVSQAQATLDAIQTDLSKAVIRSPINGIVLKRSIEPGQTVAASLQAPVLFTLAEDLTKMQLHVDVDEADVGQVKAGQAATFTVDAYPDRTFPARITQVRYGAQTVQGVVTYETILDVDNTDLSLRPGMTATADIVVNKVQDAVLIPNAALRFAPPMQQSQAAARSGGSLLSRLFPRHRRNSREQRETGTGNNAQKRVWTLKGNEPVALMITTGASDGVMTQVTGGAVEAGTPLVVDMSGRGG